LTPAALDLFCEPFCAFTLQIYGNDGKDALTALTYPQFSHSCSPRSCAFGNLTGVNFDIGLLTDNRDENFVELKSYLSDPKRAGEYFVDGGMYGALSLRILKFILSSGTPDDRSETEGQIRIEDESGELAIKLLPFSLTKADYMPELAELAGSVRTPRLTAEDGTLDSEIEFLHETIDQYLTKASHTPNGSQEQSDISGPDNELVNLVTVSEYMIDRYTAFPEQQVEVDKRRRNSY